METLKMQNTNWIKNAFNKFFSRINSTEKTINELEAGE